jgi:hypothetical protein
VADLAQTDPANVQTGCLPYVIATEDPDNVPTRDGFAKVKYAGMGFVLIRREVLVRMVAQYPELRYQTHNPEPDGQTSIRYALFNCLLDAGDGVFLGEDYSFCKRWANMGGEIWADLHSRLTHVGSFEFKGNVASIVAPRINR